MRYLVETMVEYFQTLARYNTVANERIYAACAALDDAQYRHRGAASFGSIHRTLNHIMVGDRIWMGRFEGVDSGITKLDAVLFEDLATLTQARREDDLRIEQYTARLTAETLASTLHYTNMAGREFDDSMAVLLGHMFNHQTHHRGQIHVMLSEAGVRGLSLDMHRIVNPG
ncbi:MAG: DinB family protein [Bryobacteraceae bacterium]